MMEKNSKSKRCKRLTVIDTQGSQQLGAYYFAFEIVLSNDITENFTYNNDTYTYTATGSTPAGQNFYH